MSNSSVIDLSKLPTPKVIEELDYEVLFQEYLSDFTARDEEYDGLLESDPAIIILEVMAYREMLVRKRINESAKATLLAFAKGSDLDHILAEYGVPRLDGEDDDRFRMRGQMALDGFSTAGPIDAYKFFALSASVKVSDEPGKVIVTILSTEGDGTAVRRESVPENKITVTDGKATLSGKSIDHLVVKDVSGGQTYKENFDYTFDKANSLLAVTVDSKISNNTELLVSYERADVLELVELALNHEDARPLTDHVSVVSAEIIKYSISAHITVYSGPSCSVVEDAANDAIKIYTNERHAMGELVAISGIYQALHVNGVKKVQLDQPLQDIETTKLQAAYCEKISLTMEIFNE